MSAIVIYRESVVQYRSEEELVSSSCCAGTIPQLRHDSFGQLWLIVVNVPYAMLASIFTVMSQYLAVHFAVCTRSHVSAHYAHSRKTSPV